MSKAPLQCDQLVYVSESILPSTQANSIQVVRMCEAFVQCGTQVTLLGFHGNGDSKWEDLKAAYGVNDSFKVQTFCSKGARFSEWRYVLGVLRRILKSGPRIIYGRHIRTLAVAALAGRPVVLELHCLPPEGSKTSRFFLPLLLRQRACVGVVVISDILRKDFCRRFRYQGSKVMVAHDGAGQIVQQIRVPFSNGGRPRVGYAGHLYPGKGMEVVARLVHLCPWADFQIVGGTSMDIQKWRNAIGECSNVEFVGWVQPSDVAGYISGFDIALLPNQRQVESSGRNDIGRYTSPLKLFEYMACGRPILASNLPVFREILRDGENAILCDPDRVDEWVEALRRLCSDPGLARSLGGAAREAFVRQYTWKIRASVILEWMRTVLSVRK